MKCLKLGGLPWPKSCHTKQLWTSTIFFFQKNTNLYLNWELVNRMSAVVLAFLELCNLDWRSRSLTHLWLPDDNRYTQWLFLFLFLVHYPNFTKKSTHVNSKVCLLVGWLLNVPATCECISGTDLLNFTCCQTEIEVADPTFYLTQSQYTDNGPTSPSTDPTMPGTWQGSHWSANFWVTGMTRPWKNPQSGFGLQHSTFFFQSVYISLSLVMWTKQTTWYFTDPNCHLFHCV